MCTWTILACRHSQFKLHIAIEPANGLASIDQQENRYCEDDASTTRPCYLSIQLCLRLTQPKVLPQTVPEVKPGYDRDCAKQPKLPESGAVTPVAGEGPLGENEFSDMLSDESRTCSRCNYKGTLRICR